ncbi:hypothetical protein DEU56DRAFT_340379 [Suillus clintonianus]|uniref:uncharacterized protein n=1 Tax=Suillus clintonianus TaxID=1904413 RepID=UPI001B869003|nr:uncharacterized protein DEU56DRAFT_340379 [Suillus clintonianus]KAG2138325.1 hypothetical protein DEU56DRAFT_340379 [Suillus clintonianus]
MIKTTSCPTHLVKRVAYHEMKHKAGFLSLTEELHFYILSFLSCRDILRCTSVCKALRQTYMSSSVLQYIIELSGQRLLPVPNTDNRTSASSHLQTLRDRAYAWFKFDMHSFKSITLPEIFYAKEHLIIDGHLYFWDKYAEMAAIIPILPKSSQRTIERNWSPEMLRSVPNSVTLDVLMDPTQNLIAVVYSVVDDLEINEPVRIDLRELNGDIIHPKAAGRTLLASGPTAYNNSRTTWAKLKGCGRHIALQRVILVAASDGRLPRIRYMWQLQIWDWQNSTTSSSVLGDMILRPSNNRIDFCFLGINRLLVVAHDLKLYSIEDMSQTPQLLACFLSPLPLSYPRCLLPMDNIEQLQMQVQQMMYTSDPTHRLLCLTTSFGGSTLVFVISTRIFFDLDGIAVATPIPWKLWGPSNARIFRHRYRYPCRPHISGNRVLQAFAVGTPDSMEYEIHMMDFSPLAVTNRQGLGRVVKEPSTIEIIGLASDNSREELQTSLPYVEVVSDRKISVGELESIWLDNDRIYLLCVNRDRRSVAGFTQHLTSQSSRLEVIDV